MNYIDQNGEIIFVATGLGGEDFGSFRKSKSGGLHRVKSNDMPMVTSKEEAQTNLDKWAKKKGLKQQIDFFLGKAK